MTDDADSPLHPKHVARESEQTLYPKMIFMKLAYDLTLGVGGPETIAAHLSACQIGGAAWFSTDSLYAGMASRRRVEFLNAIRAGHVVQMYFALGAGQGQGTEFSHVAEVLDIVSRSEGIISPDSTLTPKQWASLKRKLWIKIRNIVPCISTSTDDFIISSTGRVLTEALAHSQLSFVYIRQV